MAHSCFVGTFLLYRRFNVGIDTGAADSGRLEPDILSDNHFPKSGIPGESCVMRCAGAPRDSYAKVARASALSRPVGVFR